jgi:branched-chain amino acid transport system substrate-binding protein
MLQGLGAAGLAGVAGCTGGGGVSGVSIGVLQPLSGDLEYYGQQSTWGFYSGLAYKGDTDPPGEATTGSETVTVDDTDYELYVRDTQFSPDQAQSLATDLVQNQDIDMLFGTSSSGAARRVISTVAKPEEIPFMAGPAASAGITSNSEFCGDLIFRASENTAMDARSGGRYVAQQGDVESVYLFGADYAFGRAVVNNYESVLEAEGVEIVGKRFVQRGYSDWGPLLDNAEESGADGIVAGFTVVTLPAIFTAYLQGDYSYSVFGGFATQITNNAIGGVMQNVLGTPLTREKLQQSGMGPFTTRYHWNQYDNDINSSFVDTYTDTYGVVPDLFSSGTFTAASAIVQAVNQAGSAEGADIAEELSGMTVTDTPKGEDAYTFQGYNNQARSAMTVADVIPTQDEYSESWGAAVQPSEPVATIPADQTTIPQDAPGMNCSL